MTLPDQEKKIKEKDEDKYKGKKRTHKFNLVKQGSSIVGACGLSNQ